MVPKKLFGAVWYRFYESVDSVFNQSAILKDGYMGPMNESSKIHTDL